VREWRVGDAVMGIVGGGGYATRLVIHERQALPVPSTVKVADAAAIPEVFLTAWDALVVQGGLTSGRTALIHAGGSGVGTAGIQIARAIGARSVTTASLGKHDRLRALGADVVIERSPNDWLAEVLAAVPHGVDVVLDVVGEGDRNVAALRSGGRIVQVGVMGGGGTVSLGALMGKRAAVIGTTLRMRPIEEKISLAQRFRAEMLPLFESGHLVPVIDRRFALDDVAEAHRYMESDANVGKILLDIAD
jgi:NADPH:quinone reductase-like Zn-dependent oxidoreductase